MEMLGFCSAPAEGKLLCAAAFDTAASFDLPQWQVELIQALTAFYMAMSERTQVDIGCVDLTSDRAIAAAEELRRRFASAKILLIANPEMSPAAYLKPSIMAASLLLRPFSREQALDVFQELVRVMLRKPAGDDGAVFTIKTKKGRVLLNHMDISYFEARERKIFACANGRQYPFYDTLEGLQDRLPVYFLRCHKGYIVNRWHIKQIDYTNNLVVLEQDSIVPISRSYKSAVKEFGV